MEKQGFTLVELLVVVAIIAVLSIIIIPSVISVNKNINKRMLSEKEENIETAAQLYATKNDDIFNGVDEVYVYVYELINYGYLTVDVNTADSRCKSPSTTKGCMIDPTNNNSLNNYYVILRKQGVGYSAEFVYDTSINGYDEPIDLTLYETVCDQYAQEKLVGKAPNGKRCYCYTSASSTTPVGKDAAVLKDETGATVNACIIAGENPNNYLRYGDSKPNWRVLGVYNLGTASNPSLSAKMITSEPI